MVRLEVPSGIRKYVIKLLISIPLWYDWKTMQVVSQRYNKYFNSTMVRLEVQEEANKRLANQFQFHYGTIGRFE